MAGQALFFLCDESLLSGAKEKTKVGASEASDRLLLAVHSQLRITEGNPATPTNKSLSTPNGGAGFSFC